MEQIAKYLKDSYGPWWDSIEKGTRLVYMAVTAAILIAIVLLAVIALRPRYETLYTGLDSNEASQIVEKLQELKIPYKVGDSGNSVQVRRKDIYDVRLKMASEGLPRSGTVGFEIFDKTNLGMTEFLQKVNYRRALEGELAKSISTVREIKSARVHLVIPEPRLFREDKKDATASIILSLYGARSLSNRQVEGIAYLVSSSVEGLSPQNVTILDSSGRLLSERKWGDEISSLSSSQLELRKSVESYLESKAKGMLDPVIGFGKSAVTVSADLNFEQVEKNIESYDPDNVAIRSEEKTTEKNSEQNTKADGQGKVITNSNETAVTNYEINKTIQHVISQVGNIQRLWVAVLVDGSYKEAPAGGKKEAVRQYVPRSQEELDKISGIVKSAVGFLAERNDIIEMANVPFETNQQVEEEGVSIFNNIDTDYWLDVFFKILLLVAGVMILLKMRKAYASFMKRQRVIMDRRMAEEEARRQREEAMPKLKNEPQLVDHFRNIAKEKPAEVAKVVKTMMIEE